jgi:hypothetical protein
MCSTAPAVSGWTERHGAARRQRSRAVPRTRVRDTRLPAGTGARDRDARSARRIDQGQPRRAAREAGLGAHRGRQRGGRARQPRVPRPRDGPRDRGTGLGRDRRRRDPLGLPCLLQAGRPGFRDAVASGRALLADPSAGDLHGVGGARGVEQGERLPSRDPALPRRRGAASAPARGPQRPHAQPAHGRRQFRRGRGGGPRTRTRPDVDARCLHDPRREGQHVRQAPDRRRAALHAGHLGLRARPAPGRRQERSCRRLRTQAALAGPRVDRTGRNDFRTGHRSPEDARRN